MSSFTSNKPKAPAPAAKGETTRLVEGLESMRDELGQLADELITLLRGDGAVPEKTRSGFPQNKHH